MVVGYGPNERDGEERERFWNDMDKTLDSVGNGYLLRILRDLTGWIRERTRAEELAQLVLLEFQGRMIMVEEWWNFGQNTYFKHRSLHKHTRMARGQDRVEVKSILDLVLVKRDMLRYVQDMVVVRGICCDMCKIW